MNILGRRYFVLFFANSHTYYWINLVCKILEQRDVQFR